MAKHYPPAYKRYREKNKTISIVLTKTTKDALDNARGDLSYSKFVQSLFVPDGAFSQFEEQSIQLAFERDSINKEKKELSTIERFTVPCKNCGKPMFFNNQKRREQWNEKVKPILEKAFSDWVHVPDCRGKK